MRFLLSVLLLLALCACTEAQLGAHVAKQLSAPKQQGYFKVGTPYVVEGKRYYPQESYDLVETGIASWYGSEFHGKRTANGEIFNCRELTGAHRTLQLPSLVRVTNLENGRSLVVRVNDRGPYKRGRIIDLSEKAAELLGFKANGTARVKLQVLNRESKAIAEAARRGIDTRGVEVAMNEGRPYPAPPADTGIQQASFEAAGTRSVQPVSSEPLPLTGHIEKGVFLPDPVVSQMPIQPTSLFIQAGAFTIKENALKYASSLSRFGAAQIYPVNIKGVQFYRVRIGPFQQVEQADGILARMATEQFNDAIIVVD